MTDNNQVLNSHSASDCHNNYPIHYPPSHCMYSNRRPIESIYSLNVPSKPEKSTKCSPTGLKICLRRWSCNLYPFNLEWEHALFRMTRFSVVVLPVYHCGWGFDFYKMRQCVRPCAGRKWERREG